MATYIQKIILISCVLSLSGVVRAQSDTIVQTEAYLWCGDSILQGEFVSTAVSPFEIRSTYSARPHYYMPIEKVWKKRNDLSNYPKLHTGNTLLNAVYNMALDEMVNAVEPDTTLRTGKEWSGVWTRDVSYSIILSMAALQPEASMISLLRKVNAEGQIVQDTGSGGAWPISTDRMIWALAAWEVYKVTGDRAWLEKVYPIIARSLKKDFESVYSRRGLVKGETSFIDWREQSYPQWMQTADIASSEAMNTNIVQAAALSIAGEMAKALGKDRESGEYFDRAEKLADRINSVFWMPDKGYYGMYIYGRDYPILNPRAETLGESLAILFDVATPDMARSISEHVPVTPYGAAVFFPQIANIPNYHNNALWPFVASYWALANAKVRNEAGTLEAIGSVVRPAALFATNKENLNLDNGDIFTELNSSNMLWSLSGNLAITQRILFGIHFEPDGLLIAPFVPETLADSRELRYFPYRGARINIRVEGFGDAVKTLMVNGKEVDPKSVIPASMLAGGADIRVVMNGEKSRMKITRTPNKKAPLTPVVRLEHDADAPVGSPLMNRLTWNPIEYISFYEIVRNGKPVARTRTTTYPALKPGEWQVIGYSSENIPSFASEPLNNSSQHIFEPEDCDTMIHSSEISYPGIPEGYRGKGFAETDHSRKSVKFKVNVPKAGNYGMSFRYANGNGPVNTENKAAIRSVLLNKKKVGTVVLPQRGSGNWQDWGSSSVLSIRLPEGESEIELLMLPEDENMNLKTNHALVDEVILTEKE